VFNLTGGTRASFTGSAVPSGYISSGQGFLVEAVTAGNVTFNNSMRSKVYSNSQFFRNSIQQPANTKGRVWLNLQNQDGMFSQQLIGYQNESTLGIDPGYDGIVNATRNYVNFYSFIADEKFKVQGRGGFNLNDQVPLGYFSSVSDTFTIAIDNRDGLLSGTDVNIYLEDQLLNVIHDLKQSPYVFTTQEGTYDDRFVLRYTNSSLGNEDFDVNDNSVIVSADGSRIKVKSENETIAAIAVYDILGRTIFETKEVGSKSFSTDKIAAQQQALIVKTTLKNHQVVSRKIIY